jgi:uncharacterized protein YecE (DUF72 family)
MATAYIGISGYVYQHWKGAFYPPGLAQRKWLSYAAGRFNSIELNGTFYSLKWPSVYQRWISEVPSEGFVFAIKGSRFITHRLRLRNTRQAMANFLGSGILALGHLTGPFLWQLPPSDRFDAARLAEFLQALPRSSDEAAAIAREHDERLKRGALTDPATSIPLRHAFEVRHESYDRPEFYNALAEHGCAFVLADTAGRFMFADRVTADFVYLRLHGSQQLYVSRYSDEELDWWADEIRQWLAQGRDVYAYFDNDAQGHAPYDAMRLAERVNGRSAGEVHPGERFRGRMDDPPGP